jgi:hypothetical protein
LPTGDGVIVLRDATESGPAAFTVVDHYHGLSLAQVMAVVEHLSAIHASATSQLITGQGSMLSSLGIFVDFHLHIFGTKMAILHNSIFSQQLRCFRLFFQRKYFLNHNIDPRSPLAKSIY